MGISSATLPPHVEGTPPTCLTTQADHGNTDTFIDSASNVNVLGSKQHVGPRQDKSKKRRPRKNKTNNTTDNHTNTNVNSSTDTNKDTQISPYSTSPSLSLPYQDSVHNPYGTNALMNYVTQTHFDHLHPSYPFDHTHTSHHSTPHSTTQHCTDSYTTSSYALTSTSDALSIPDKSMSNNRMSPYDQHSQHHTVKTKSVTGISGNPTVLQQIGNLQLEVKDSSSEVVTLPVNNALRAHNLKFNILSLLDLTKAGWSATLQEGNSFLFNKESQQTIPLIQEGFGWKLPPSRFTTSLDNTSASPDHPKYHCHLIRDNDLQRYKIHKDILHITAKDLHQILAHRSHSAIMKAYKKGLLKNVKLTEFTKRECIACRTGKPQHAHGRDSDRVPERPGVIVFCDIAGPIPTGIGGFNYFIIFVDGYSSLTHTIPIVFKSDAAVALEEFVIMFNTQTKHKICCIRTDNALDLNSKAFNHVCSTYGIVRENTTAYSPYQNGKAERFIRTVKETTATIMATGVAHCLWPYAIVHVCFCLNAVHLVMHPVTKKEVSPYMLLNEGYSNPQPDVSFLVPFGCLAIVTLSKQKRDSGITPPSVIGMYVGFDRSTKNAKVYIGDGRVVVARNVIKFPHIVGTRRIMEVARDHPTINDTAIFDELLYHDNDELSDMIKSTSVNTSISVTDEEAVLLKDHFNVIETTTEEGNIVFKTLDEVSKHAARAVSNKKGSLLSKFVAARRGLEVVNYGEFGCFEDDSSKEYIINDVGLPDHDEEVESTVAKDHLASAVKTDINSVPVNSHYQDQDDMIEGQHDPTQVRTTPYVTRSNRVSVPTTAFSYMAIYTVTVPTGDDQQPQDMLYSFHIDYSDPDVPKFTPLLSKKPRLPRSLLDVSRLPPNLRDEWQIAILNEIEKLFYYRVFDIVRREDIPEGTKILRGVWVFTEKSDSSLKARYTLDGSAQVELYPGQFYSSVVRYESVRTILHFCASLDYVIETGDFESAYLQGKSDNDIYAVGPKTKYSDNTYYVRVPGNMYGLKSASSTWHKALYELLTSLGFTSTTADQSVFVFHSDGVHAIIAVYVDDLLMACTSQEWLDDIKLRIKEKYNINYKGCIHNSTFLGMLIMRDRPSKTIKLSLKNYIHKVNTDVFVTNSNPSRPAHAKYPIYKNHNLPKFDVDARSEEYRSFNYPKVAGIILYIALVARPDVSFLSCKLAQHMNASGDIHCIAAKRGMRYLEGSKDDYLLLGGDPSTDKSVLDVNAYCDADWANDKNDSKSVSGLLARIGNSPIFWRSAKQQAVAMSTAEAELYALVRVIRETMWLSHLVQDLGFNVNFPVPIHCDNEAAIAIANSDASGLRRLIRMNTHYPRDMSERGYIKINYTKSALQLADGLTKALDETHFVRSKSDLSIFSP